MNLFGPVIGSDLPLISLSPPKIARLSGQKHWDFNEQVRHQCIRRAWAISKSTSMPASEALEIEAGRASVVVSNIFGLEVNERSIERDIGRAQAENESACFGLYLIETIDAVLNRTPRRPEGPEGPEGPKFFDDLSKLIGLNVIHQAWRQCRDIYASPYHRRTAVFAQESAGRDGFIDQCEPLLAAIKNLELATSGFEQN